MSIRDISLSALIFVVIYNILFFGTNFGIGTGLFFLFLNGYFFFTRDTEGRNLNLALFNSALSVLFAFHFSFRGNGIVQIINLILASFFSAVALYFYKYTGQIWFRILNFIWIPFLVIERSVGAFLELFRETDKIHEANKNNYSALIRGLLIALPIFAVLLFLLVQADPIFGKLTQDIFENIGERTVVSIILFIILISLGLAKFFPKISEKVEQVISGGKSHELSIIAGSIISLFAIFIIIQFRYLFISVGERELQQLGISSLTYSEYVRKGFFELLIAAVISSGVIVYIFKYLHYLKNPQKQLLQAFSAILTVETGLLLLSAAKRLALYADAHGLTRARIFGFIFLLWLAMLLAIFLIRAFRELKEKEFFISNVFITLIMFLSLNIINIDGLIAQKYKPTVNGEIDYYYLTSLSTDARGSWKESIIDAEQVVIKLERVESISPEDNRKLYWISNTITQLNFKVGDIIDKYGSKFKWQAFNFSEYAAYQDIIKNKGDFEKIPNLLNRIEKLRAKVSPEVQRNTRLDRSINPPLLQ